MSKDPLILVTQEYPDQYRLNMYLDFALRLPVLYPNSKIYGKGYTKNINPSHLNNVITTYNENKTLDDIIKEDLGGVEPDVLFMFSPDFAVSNIKKYKTKVFTFISDSVHTNRYYIDIVRKHNFDCRGVFYNYLYGQELIKPSFQSDNAFYFPCWSSLKYDYANYNYTKQIDFFMSGTITNEYAYRQKFRNMFRGSNLNYVDKFMSTQDTKDDNDKFLDLLGKSKYSPHDGGINGRIQGRFYESSFMKSVVISPDLGEEMKRAGFENNTNCILFNRNEQVDKVNDILRNIDKYDWDCISNNAYNLIKERHTTDHRIKAFLDIVLNN
jgi:hypothetical protein